jgi:hypothetical protein
MSSSALVNNQVQKEKRTSLSAATATKPMTCPVTGNPVASVAAKPKPVQIACNSVVKTVATKRAEKLMLPRHPISGPLAFALLVVAAGVAPALAFDVPNNNAALLLTQHQMELRYADSQPQRYPMNYLDEVAQTLGMRRGQWEAFSPQSSGMPSLKGRIKGGRPMFILQWGIGQ